MNLRSILLACLAANGAQGTPQTVKIACFGDSVTAGSRAEGQPWCKQLRKLLGTGYFATSNFGGSGRTVVNYDGLAPDQCSDELGPEGDCSYGASDYYEEWKDEEVPCAREAPFTVGIIALGTNDAKTANLEAYDETQFQEQYQALIKSIVETVQEGGADLKLLVLCSAVPIAGLPIDQVNREEWDESSQMWVGGALRDDVEALAAWADNEFDDLAGRVRFVDLYDVLSNHPEGPEDWPWHAVQRRRRLRLRRSGRALHV